MASTQYFEPRQRQCNTAGNRCLCYTCWAMTSFSIIGLLAFLLCLAAPASASADSVKKCLLLSYMLLSRWRIFTRVSKICFSTVLGMCPSSYITPAVSDNQANSFIMCDLVQVELFLHIQPMPGNSQNIMPNSKLDKCKLPCSMLTCSTAMHEALPCVCCRHKEDSMNRAFHLCEQEAVMQCKCPVTPYMLEGAVGKFLCTVMLVYA